MNPNHTLSFDKRTGHTGYLAIRKTLPTALARTQLAFHLIGRLVDVRYVPNVSVFMDESRDNGIDVDDSVVFLSWVLGQVTVAFGETWVNRGAEEAFELPGMFDIHTNLARCEVELQNGLKAIKQPIR